MTIYRAFAVALAWAAFMGLFFPRADAQEGGMIPLDSPVGEIGGRGHWYSLRTMKAETYYQDPPVMSDIVEDDAGYSVSGEPPVDVSLVLHPSWGYSSGEPWREAINWVREAEQMYRNSGVPLRFVIKSIQTYDEMPDTVEAAYNAVPFSLRGDADLLVILLPYMAGDSYCGIAGIGGSKSASACSSMTLAHELGHNFGLYHAHNPGKEGRKGHCMRPEADAIDCYEGTIMSYAGSGRVPLFAHKDFTYQGSPLGTAEHDAVAYLNEVKTKKALLSETASPSYVYGLSEDPYATEHALCR